MTPIDVIDIGRDALWVLIKVSAPIMLTALIVGLIIALFQALTQIQEMTLTFVPKILAIFFTLMMALPFMFEQLKVLNDLVAERILDLYIFADIPIETDEGNTAPALRPSSR